MLCEDEWWNIFCLTDDEKRNSSKRNPSDRKKWELVSKNLLQSASYSNQKFVVLINKVPDS